MSVLLSGADIIDMAVQTEVRGESFYRQAAELAKKQAAKDLFTFLGNEEIRHKQVFEGLSSAIFMTAIDPTTWEETMDYITAAVDSEFFQGSAPIRAIPAAATTSDMLKQAIEFEKQTLLFFYSLRDLVQARNQPIVDKIIAEEKTHVVRLSAMLKDQKG